MSDIKTERNPSPAGIFLLEKDTGKWKNEILISSYQLENLQWFEKNFNTSSTFCQYNINGSQKGVYFSSILCKFMFPIKMPYTATAEG